MGGRGAQLACSLLPTNQLSSPEMLLSLSKQCESGTPGWHSCLPEPCSYRCLHILQAALWKSQWEIKQAMGLSELGLLQEKEGSFPELLGWEHQGVRAC